MNNQNNRKLHLLLNKLGLNDQKESLVYSFTNNRTVHSSEMTDLEAMHLNKHLQNMLENKQKQVVKDSCDGMRKYIISIFYRKYNVQTNEQKAEALRLCKEWVLKHFKCDLNELSSQDLFKVKLVAEKMYKDGAKAVRRAVQNAN